MGRYNYRPHTLTVSMQVIDLMDEVQNSREDIDGFAIHDARHGNTEDVWIAFSRDQDTTQRIVALLNEDDRKKGTAK
jgi:hypothetical protein